MWTERLQTSYLQPFEGIRRSNRAIGREGGEEERVGDKAGAETECVMGRVLRFGDQCRDLCRDLCSFRVWTRSSDGLWDGVID